jgi:hypothetical protein
MISKKLYYIFQKYVLIVEILTQITLIYYYLMITNYSFFNYCRDMKNEDNIFLILGYMDMILIQQHLNLIH